MTKIGVIIQGPLITFGQGPNNSQFGFNTFYSIVENINNLKAYNYSYIVSTWKPANDAEKNCLKNLEINHIDVLSTDIPQLNDPDHRYKHHYGIYKGITKLQDCDYIIKIRSDMIMPLCFWDWSCKILNTHPDKLFVSELLNTPFYMGDFIYIGSKNTLTNFILSIMSFKEKILHPSIVFDIGLKYMYSQNVLPVKLNNYTSDLIRMYLTKNNVILNCWNKFLITYIDVMPKYIWESIQWREKKIGDLITASAFKFDLLPVSNNAIDMNFLLSEYCRFWKKRKDKRYFLAKNISYIYKLYYKTKSFLSRSK
jgi:hypothetical protein